MKNNNSWALITGASRGLGYAYAIELLSLGYNIICVARNLENLEELQKEYTNNKIKLISLDLSKEENNIKLYEQIKKDNINLIINNVGIGKNGSISDISLEDSLKMIDLNIKSMQIF